ncbi:MULTISPECIES: SRPBCC family protein [unclassified Neptuniibacter]|jgi:mxaD protein|uniref:SRPBCC family protein n=1 Tax=unclassified Neptuniibacter TaxID=2630693 RepID=UPI0026E42F67|nr:MULTISPECIES: SRPBCC family protein [unclassified Neptuniibacter]MDO6514272.1 SRPBCC family protein [Neptuniibacter sp. 2_MG-2023]MDO6592599.1 SRPBCC family protein [Neptuniibacter sp. 1_MG-2023]
MKQKQSVTRKVLIGLIAASGMLSSTAFAAGNINIEETANLNVKPAGVWALVGDFNSLNRWLPGIVASDRTGDTRVLTLGDGGKVTEILLEEDNVNHSYRYAITDSPLPVSDYEAQITVKPNGKGGSVMTWKTSFNAAGLSDKEAEDVMRGVLKAGVGNLEKLYN